MDYNLSTIDHKLLTIDFLEFLRRKQFSYKNLATHERMLLFYLKWVDRQGIEVEQISYQDLLAFIKACHQRGSSQKTIQNYINTIRHFYDHLIESGQVATNPTLGIEIKNIKRKVLYHILEAHVLHQLYNEYPDKSLRDQRNKVVLGLLVYQGLKVDEIAKLEMSHVDLREGKINVPSSLRSNGREMTLEAVQMINTYDYIQRVRPLFLEMRPKRKSQTKVDTDRLIVGEGGYCHSVSKVVSSIIKKLQKGNHNLLNAKQIRASVITKWVKSYHLRKAQYLAGHRYIGTTEGYLQNDLDGLKEQINQFHPLG